MPPIHYIYVYVPSASSFAVPVLLSPRVIRIILDSRCDARSWVDWSQMMTFFIASQTIVRTPSCSLCVHVVNVTIERTYLILIFSAVYIFRMTCCWILLVVWGRFLNYDNAESSEISLYPSLRFKTIVITIPLHLFVPVSAPAKENTCDTRQRLPLTDAQNRATYSLFCAYKK